MVELSLIKQRDRIKAKLIAFGNFLTLLESEPEGQVELSSRIEKVENLWFEFDSIQNKIEESDETASQMQQRLAFKD